MSYNLVGFFDGGDSVLLITLLGPGVPVTFQLFESGLQRMDSYLYRQSLSHVFSLALGSCSMAFFTLSCSPAFTDRRHVCLKPSHAVSSVVMVPTENVCRGFPSSGL